MFLETNDLQVQHELTLAAAVFWAKACLEGRWTEDTCAAWKTDIRSKDVEIVRGPAVHRELKDLEIKWRGRGMGSKSTADMSARTMLRSTKTVGEG